MSGPLALLDAAGIRRT